MRDGEPACLSYSPHASFPRDNVTWQTGGATYDNGRCSESAPLGLEVLLERRGGGDGLAGVRVVYGRGVAGVGHAAGSDVLLPRRLLLLLLLDRRRRR